MRRSICSKISLVRLMSVAVLAACSSHTPAIPPAPAASQRVEATPVALQQTPADSSQADYFNAKILPITGKCQPCHFKGGKMHAQLPFDDPKTIRRLGEKLFSRIQDKNEQAVLRAFFASATNSTK